MNRSAAMLGQEGFFEYNSEGSIGILTFTSSSGAYQRSVRDLDVVAVVEHDQQILLVLNSGDPDSEPSAPEAKFESLQVKNLPPSYVELHSRRPPSYFLVSSYRDATPNFHIIVSVRSGTGEAQHFYSILKNVLHSLQMDETSYKLHTTESEKSITDLARTVFLPRAQEGFAQTIVLLSGDGGIVDLVNVLLSSPEVDSYVKPVVGLLVLGTGNALANSTGINRGATKGLRTLLKGRPHSLPTFTATFSPGSEFLVDEARSTEPLPQSDDGVGVVHGAVVCSWALHASLVADSDTTEYRRYGNQRFSMAGKELVMPSDGSASHVYQGKITVFRKDQEGHEVGTTLDRHAHGYILASFVSNLEEKFMISPDSKPLDGQLRLIHFGALSGADVMKIMALAFQGGLHVRDKAVGYDEIDGLRIDLEEADSRWRRICVDGKIVRVNKGGWVEIRKEKRDVLDIIVDF